MSAYFAFFFSFFFSVLFCFFVFFISLSDGLAFRALHLTHSFHGNYTQCWRWYELAVSETKVLEKKLFLFFFYIFLKITKKIKKEKIHLPSHINTTKCDLTCCPHPPPSPSPPFIFNAVE